MSALIYFLSKSLPDSKVTEILGRQITLTCRIIKHTLSLFHVSNDVNIYISPFSISVVSFDLVVLFAFYLSDYIVTKSLTSTLFVVLVGLWSGTELELVKIEVY